MSTPSPTVDATAPTSGHGGSPSHGVDGYWWYVARSDLLEAALAPYALDARRGLDLGSADSPSAGWFRRVVSEAACLDIDRRGLTAGEAGVCGSALDLPFEDGAFDVVSAFDVIEHCDPQERALAEVHRVVRPGGVFLMSVPAYQWAWTDFDVANGHHRRYTRRRAARAVEGAGFEVLRVSHGFAATFPLFAAERLVRRLRGARTDGAHDIVDVPTVSRPLHHMLMALCRLDEHLLPHVDLPFGSSVFLAARKPV